MITNNMSATTLLSTVKPKNKNQTVVYLFMLEQFLLATPISFLIKGPNAQSGMNQRR